MADVRGTGTAFIARDVLPTASIIKLPNSRGIPGCYDKILLVHIHAPPGFNHRKYSYGIPSLSTPPLSHHGWLVTDCVLSCLDCTTTHYRLAQLPNLNTRCNLTHTWSCVNTCRLHTHYSPAGLSSATVHAAVSTHEEWTRTISCQK